MMNTFVIPDNVTIPPGTSIRLGEFIGGTRWMCVDKVIVDGNLYTTEQLYHWSDPDFPDYVDVANAVELAKAEGGIWVDYLNYEDGEYEFECDGFFIIEDDRVQALPKNNVLGRIDVDQLQPVKRSN